MVYLPLWKIWVRQLGLFFPIYGKIEVMFQTTNQNVSLAQFWNTQPFWNQQPTHPNSQRPGKPHVSTPFQRISNLQSHKQRHLPRTIPFWGYSTPWKVAHDITVFYYFSAVIPWFLTELGSIRVFITQWLAHWRSRKAIDWQLNFGFDHPVSKTNPRHGNFWVQHFWIHHRGWKGVVTRERGR